jgi:Ca2+:H+ antiporter
MPISPHAHDDMPAWTWAAPAAASALLALKFAQVVPADAAPVLLLAAALLFAAVFAAVHHAEVLALRLGEPFGSILLAVAVTVIEVALIVSLMLAGAPGSEMVARDAVFAAVMIILNVVVGLCLVLGGNRHHVQTFRHEGASAALAVLGTLAVLTLVLPNFTIAVRGPLFSRAQLLFVGGASLVLWGAFVFVQTVRHRDYFLDAPADGDPVEPAARPSWRTAVISGALLLVSLAAVVLLAKVLSHPMEAAVAAAGLPSAFVGVVIAAVVLLPESVASVKAALHNRLQNSINLALGSAIASIGLTIPVVAVVSQVLHQPLVLGVDAESMVMLLLTLFVSVSTLGSGRTTVLQGVVHLVIGGVFLLLSAVP